MATLEQLLAGAGIGDEIGQTKTASSAAPTSSEVNQVLENLGIAGIENAGVTKTASEGTGMQGLTDIYESLFTETVVEDTQTKTAAAATTTEQTATTEVTETEVEKTASTAFGEVVGTYFNVLCDNFVAEVEGLDKVAGDLEAEAGEGYAPQGGGERSELSKIIGKEGDPALKVNRDASSGAGLKVNPGNQTPYSLKAGAQIKQILKRKMKSEPGDVGGFNE